MHNQAGRIGNGWRSLFLATAGVAALAVPVGAGVLTAPRLWAQAPAQSPAVPQWQIDAGGKMAFEVGSVKPSTGVPNTNVNLSGLDMAAPSTGGLLSAVNWGVNTYIGFAYKLNGNQMRFLQSELPKWAGGESFSIDARASGNPTRDQMRLMMQSLLADRFKLAAHYETRQLPVYVLVLAKPGKTGSQIVPHTDNPPCAVFPPPAGSAPPQPPTDGWPLPICGALSFNYVSGHTRAASRNLTMQQFAGFLLRMSGGAVDRPVLDQTGLTGSFDFRLEFTPQTPPQANGAPIPNFTPDETGPTFIEALQEQLGLKLVPQTGPVDVLVIDHIEEPSPN